MYDRQLIVQAAHPDGIIQTGSANLNTKAGGNGIPTALVDFPVAGEPDYHKRMHALVDAVRDLTSQSRLYVRGHGSWRNQTVGRVDARTWARTLLNAGLRKVSIISICACQAARDRGTADACRIANSADSFASQFHKHLRDMANYETVVYARVYKVSVRNAGPVGTKRTSHRDIGIEPRSKRANSKLKFSWEGGQQKREWVDYQHGGTTSVEEEIAIGELMAMDL